MHSLPDLRFFIHYGLHFLLPGIVAILFFPKSFKLVWILMLLSMSIDLDHLFATPIFDSTRCSIGFHFLHSYFAIAIYVVAIFFKKSRIIGIGLVLHILIDFLDCFLMTFM
jgi:hypothetical protein